MSKLIITFVAAFALAAAPAFAKGHKGGGKKPHVVASQII